MAHYADKTFITNKNLYSVKVKSDRVDVNIILPLINSKLISFTYIKEVSQATKDDFPQITIKDFLSLPFPDEAKLISAGERLLKLVDQIILFMKRIENLKTPQEKTALQRQIDATDNQIDQLVYKLYGLSEKEIKIVEGV